MKWEKVSEELSKPLDPRHVKGRQQGGGNVQYVEGWHVIAEMNRVFGFGEWSRETIDLRQLGDPREVNGKIRVEYMARVRLTVGGVTRDGCGFGQGIDKDVGQAHESGLKEAETDAMKRAAMTFGSPFGLALYDKSRENVRAPAPDPMDICNRIVAAMEGPTEVEGLEKFWTQPAVIKALDALPAEMQDKVTAAYSARWNELEAAAA